MQYRGIDYLRDQLNSKRPRVLLRYKYYEQKDIDWERTPTVPEELKSMFRATSGWCAKAVDSVADRLVFNKFAEDNFGIQEIYDQNNPDILYDNATHSALISACSFIYISADKNGFPRLQVIDGGNATGVLDPITGMMPEGYAVLSRDDFDRPTREAYFTVERTYFYEMGKLAGTVPNPADFCLLVPIINRPDARRVFGHSRISRTCMYLQKFAKRTLERSEISAEFYAYPQRYVLGLNPEAEQMDKWKATVTSMLQFDKDDEGDHPVVGQFQQQTMSPYSEQLRTIASAFAGETGLLIDDLGFANDNPASADAIKASHENLRLTASKCQRTFGSGFLNAGFLAACVRDNYAYSRSQLYRTIPRWKPLFEADFATLAGAGDSLMKLQQAFPDYITNDKLEDLLGL